MSVTSSNDGTTVTLGADPPDGAPACPDENAPYAWLGGKWVLLASDTADGIPDKLDLPDDSVYEGPLMRALVRGLASPPAKTLDSDDSDGMLAAT